MGSGSVSPIRDSGKPGEEEIKKEYSLLFTGFIWFQMVPTSPGHTTTISVFRRQRMDDLKHEASLVYIARLCLTYQNRTE